MKRKINKIRELIQRNRIKEAIQELSNLLNDDHKLDEVIIQSAREYNLEKQIRTGEITFESAGVERNKINNSLLSILREVEAYGVKTSKPQMVILIRILIIAFLGFSFFIGYTLLEIDLSYGFIAILVILILLAGLIFFERFTRLSDSTLEFPAKILMWSFLLIILSTMFLTFSSIWFKSPIDLQYWIVVETDKEIVRQVQSSTSSANFIDGISQERSMKSLDHPDNSSFDLIKDDRTVDLRGGFKDRNKPIVWNRRITARKTDKADHFIVGSLAGDSIKFSSEDKIEKILYHYDTNNEETIVKKVYHVYIDVHDIEIGEVFDLSLNNLYYGVFFQEEDADCDLDECLDMRTYGKFNAISLRVFFDSDYLGENFKRRLLHYIDEEQTVSRVDDYTEPNLRFYDMKEKEGNFKIAIWKVEPVEYPSVYQLSWNWPN